MNTFDNYTFEDSEYIKNLSGFNEVYNVPTSRIIYPGVQNLNSIQIDPINSNNSVSISTPRAIDFNNLNTSTKTKENNKKKHYLIPCVDTKLKLITFLLIILVCFLVLITGIILIIIYAIIPCSLTRCYPNYSICSNSPFKPKCSCITGYNGDGVNYCDECGISYSQENLARIVGGISATPYSWPATVYLRFNYKTDFYVAKEQVTITVTQGASCGGTLIDRTTVLTAAHCILSSFDFTYKGYTYRISVETNSYFPTQESMYKVYLGLYNKSVINTGSDISPAIQVGVKKVIRHENYFSDNKLNDIGILKLSTQVNLNNNIQVACLPLEEWNNYPDSEVDAIGLGWGTLSSGGTTPDKLNNVKLSVYNSSMCSKVLSYYQKNWDSQICAGYWLGGKDTCQGDSGGSLYVKDTIKNKTKYISAGIVSYGDGCAQVYKPGIYTRVSYYLTWIKDKINY